MKARLLALCALSIAATLAQAQSTIGVVSGFARGRVAVVNPATHRAYLADDARGGIAVVEGTSVVAAIPLARVPTALAVNSAFNRIYAVNGEDGVLSIIDGNTNTVRNLPIGAGPPLLVNELRNRVYAGAQSARMLSMDGEGNGVGTVDVGGGACGVALNAQTDQLYVANCAGRASVVDLLTGNVTSFPVPGVRGRCRRQPADQPRLRGEPGDARFRHRDRRRFADGANAADRRGLGDEPARREGGGEPERQPRLHHPRLRDPGARCRKRDLLAGDLFLRGDARARGGPGDTTHRDLRRLPAAPHH
jgi:hypothetical protein